MSNIKTPEDMQAEYRSNLNSAAEKIAKEVLSHYGKVARRVAVHIYLESDEAIALAAQRLSEAGWAVEYGPKREGDLSEQPTIAVTTRDDFIDRDCKDYAANCLLGLLAAGSLLIVCAALAIWLATWPLIALAVTDGLVTFYATSLLSNSKSAMQKRRTALWEGSWSPRYVGIVKDK